MIPAFRLRLAVEALKQGQLVAHPTEGVWGLGCDPHNPEAVLHLLDVKQRPLKKGLILVAADINQFAPYLAGLDAKQLNTLKNTWPSSDSGAIKSHTWLVPCNTYVPCWISGGQATVALRVSNHPVVKALSKQFGGAIVSSSANISGRQPAQNHVQLISQLPMTKQSICFMPGSLGQAGKPSTIQDLQTGKIIRP